MFKPLLKSAALLLLSSCWVSGVCLDKKKCEQWEAESPKGDPGQQPNSSDCSGAGSLLDPDWRNRKNESMSFRKDCSFESSVCGKGKFSIPVVKDAVENKGEASDETPDPSEVVYQFKLYPAVLPTGTQPKEGCAPAVTLTCEFRYPDADAKDFNEISISACKGSDTTIEYTKLRGSFAR